MPWPPPCHPARVRDTPTLREKPQRPLLRNCPGALSNAQVCHEDGLELGETETFHNRWSGAGGWPGYKRCHAWDRPRSSLSGSRYFVKMSKASPMVTWAFKVSMLFSRCRLGHRRCKDPRGASPRRVSWQRITISTQAHPSTTHKERYISSWKRFPTAQSDHQEGSWTSDLILCISTEVFAVPPAILGALLQRCLTYKRHI